MRKILLILLIGGLFGFACFAQTKKKSKPKPKPIREIVTIRATDKGGAPIPPAEKSPKETDENTWNEYRNAKFNFVLTFPSEPKNVFDDETLNGLYEFSVYTEKALYRLLTQEVNAEGLDNKQLDELFEGIFQSVENQKRSRIINKKNIFLNGILGKEIISEDKDKFDVSKIRINFVRYFLLNNRQYVFSVSIPKEKYKPDFDVWAMKFLDSFALIKAVVIEELPENFRGEVDDESIYRNEFFGLSMNLPQDWRISNTGENETLREVGIYAGQTADAKKNGEIDRAMRQLKILLTVSKLPLGLPENSIIGVFAVKMPYKNLSLREIVKQSLAEIVNKPKVEGAMLTFRKSAEVFETKINGKNFAAFELEGISFNTKFKQKMYFALKNGYLLQFSFAFAKEEDLMELEKALQSIKFDK